MCARFNASSILTKLKEMKILLEKKDSEEQKMMAKALLANGIVSSIEYVTFSNNLVAKSDKEVVIAVKSVMSKFAVNSQWTAVYRVLTDFCGWDTNVTSFCKRMNNLLKEENMSCTCNYQAIQKTLSGSKILRKDFSDWRHYRIPKNDHSFKRQFFIAQEMLKLLSINA